MKIGNLLSLIRNVKSQSFSKGEILIQKGSSRKELYFIRKGLVRSYSEAVTADEEEITFQLFPENYVLGNFHSIFLQEPSKFCYQALEQTHVYSVLYDSFMEAIDQNPTLVGFSRRFLGKRVVKQAFHRVESFVFLTPEERYKKYMKDYPNVINRAPDKYIANVLGITPTSLSRIRKRIATKKI